MHPVRIDPLVLKAVLPELVLREGMRMVARVASRGEGSTAALVLGGSLVTAKVPEEVRAGDTLRLTVAEATVERVVLKLDQAQQLQTALPPPPPPLGVRPDEPRAHVRERARSNGDRASVSVAFDGPALGPLDARLELGPEGLTVGLRGRAAAVLEAAAPDLQAALMEILGKPVAIRVASIPVSVYA